MDGKKVENYKGERFVLGSGTKQTKQFEEPQDTWEAAVEQAKKQEEAKEVAQK